MYVSPLRDGGYDVADYRNIDPRFGSLAEAEAFFAEAHDHGIRVIVDLVPNHTSSEHPWFVEALARAGEPERAAELFDRLLTYSGPLGLFSEEIGVDGQLLGNYPQAFSHLALISAAVALTERLDEG